MEVEEGRKLEYVDASLLEGALRRDASVAWFPSHHLVGRRRSWVAWAEMLV